MGLAPVLLLPLCKRLFWGKTAPFGEQYGAGQGESRSQAGEPSPTACLLLEGAVLAEFLIHGPSTASKTFLEGSAAAQTPRPVLPWYFLWPRRSIYSSWLIPSCSEGQGLRTCVRVCLGQGWDLSSQRGLKRALSSQGAAGGCRKPPRVHHIPRAPPDPIPCPGQGPCPPLSVPASPSGAPSPAAAACPRRARPCFFFYYYFFCASHITEQGPRRLGLSRAGAFLDSSNLISVPPPEQTPREQQQLPAAAPGQGAKPGQPRAGAGGEVGGGGDFTSPGGLFCPCCCCSP